MRKASSQGTVTVNGDGSTWNCGFLRLCAGIRDDVKGKGTLRIEAGGSVSSIESFILGSSDSAVTVTGDGSTWEYFTLNVSANTTLRIEAGGSVSTDNLTGTGSIIRFGTATVTGPGSTWTTGELEVGGLGAVRIEDGGNASSATALIAADVAGSGSVIVTGAGSSWTIAGDLQMKPIVFGTIMNGVTLSILNGGGITVGGSIVDVGSSTGGPSSIILDGGTLDMTGGNIGGAGNAAIDTLDFRSGTLKNVAQINNGAGAHQDDGGDADPQHGQHLHRTNRGQRRHPASLQHCRIGDRHGSRHGRQRGHASRHGLHRRTGTEQRVRRASASAGILTIQNSYTQSAGGTLKIEIGGTTLGSQYDSLTIVGNAALDGIVDVALVNGFSPVAGQQFTILTATSIVDNGLALGGSAASSFSLLVNSSSVILQAIGLPGDYNDNGAVDAADYVLWRKGGPLTNEVDTPGVVNTADYTEWRARFGNTGSGVGTGADAAVPEPASELPVLIAGMFSICSRRCATVP